MLLPSALPCDRIAPAIKTSRPKLPSFEMYIPQSPTTYSSSILSSCRALHSILGGPVQQPARRALAPPLCTNPFEEPEKRRAVPRVVTPPRPRGVNKRRRDTFEEDNDPPRTPSRRTPVEDRDQYQTPKRQRRIPLDIPAGLQASDFASLGTPPPLLQDIRSVQRRQRDEHLNMPPISSTTLRASAQLTQMLGAPASPPTRSPRPQLRLQTDNPAEPEPTTPTQRELWSPSDDRRLVEMVLSKLNLSKREWNDCAKQLGRDKDSLGKRWKMLIGEGNVGLRRGLGGHQRNDLDIQSW